MKTRKTGVKQILQNDQASVLEMMQSGVWDTYTEMCSLGDKKFGVIRVYQLIEVMWLDKVGKGRRAMEEKEKGLGLNPGDSQHCQSECWSMFQTGHSLFQEKELF